MAQYSLEQDVKFEPLKIDGSIHIAWDFATDNILENIKEMLKYVKAYKIICYVLIGFNTDIEHPFELGFNDNRTYEE